jgi:hypothetical protein
MSSCLQSVAEQDADAGGAHVEANQQLYNHFTNLVSSLPSSHGQGVGQLFLHSQGWHAYQGPMVGAMVADACFASRPTDIIVATLPKSGTTWIKALLYATVHRVEHPPDAADHPFHTLGPH